MAAAPARPGRRRSCCHGEGAGEQEQVSTTCAWEGGVLSSTPAQCPPASREGVWRAWLSELPESPGLQPSSRRREWPGLPIRSRAGWRATGEPRGGVSLSGQEEAALMVGRRDRWRAWDRGGSAGPLLTPQGQRVRPQYSVQGGASQPRSSLGSLRLLGNSRAYVLTSELEQPSTGRLGIPFSRAGGLMGVSGLTAQGAAGGIILPIGGRGPEPPLPQERTPCTPASPRRLALGWGGEQGGCP